MTTDLLQRIAKCAPPNQKEKTDAEREKALKELHYFLGMSPELFMEVHGT